MRAQKKPAGGFDSFCRNPCSAVSDCDCIVDPLPDFNPFYRWCHVAGTYRAPAHGKHTGNVLAPL